MHTRTHTIYLKHNTEANSAVMKDICLLRRGHERADEEPHRDHRQAEQEEGEEEHKEIRVQEERENTRVSSH